MSGRPGPLFAVQRVPIGLAVLEARASGVRWKVLEARYCRDRTQLWRYAAEALEQLAARMQQETPGMQHLAACEDGRLAQGLARADEGAAADA